jgi:hypothetical protein
MTETPATPTPDTPSASDPADATDTVEGVGAQATAVPALSGEGRISPGIAAAAPALGPLAGLPGTWTGAGFNVIWRPKHGTDDHFLQLNLTHEHLVFNAIGGLVPNRGLKQGDIEISGVRYLQQISDGSEFPPPTGGGALHIEPGFWLNVPATTAPKAPASIVRLASIPHGTSVLAQGVAQQIAGLPPISPVDITPFTIGNVQEKVPFPGESTLTHPSALRNKPLAHGITQRLVNNPNVLLSDRLAGQTIVQTTVLHVQTRVIDKGGIRNIPFLESNAAARLLDAIFRIERVKHPDGTTFLQLQYTQQLVLDFNGLSWPHVSVANLVLTGA